MTEQPTLFRVPPLPPEAMQSMQIAATAACLTASQIIDARTRGQWSKEAADEAVRLIAAARNIHSALQTMIDASKP